MTKVTVSIITPAMNEGLIIESFVKNAVNLLHKNKISGEIIVVENGSSDKTFEKLQLLKKKHAELRVLQLPFGDKGLALAKGIEAASGEFLITVDTDLWDDNFALDSIENLNSHDIVVGSRAVSWGADERPLSSRMMNIGYNFIFKLIFNLQGTNTHAQLSFRRAKIIPLVRSCKSNALNFDTELIIRAERAGLSKIEIPVVVRESRARRYSVRRQLINTAKNFLTMLRTLGPSPDWSYVLLGLALLVGTFVRFYNYPQWFFFSVDEELNSYMTLMITSQGHFPAIGGPISGSNLYMAPWFLYFNALWFLLSGGNVLFSGIMFTALELLVIILVYLVGKRLFSPRAGAIASLLYGGSFLMAIMDRHYWNITLTPVISLLTVYSLLNYLNGRKKWFWVAAITVGFGLSTTFSVFAVFLFAILIITFFIKPTPKKDLLVFLAIIGVFHIPLLIFDLRHNFQLTQSLWAYLTTFSGNSGSLVNQTISTLILAINTFGKALIINTPLDLSDESSICQSGVNHFSPSFLTIIIALSALLYGLKKAIEQKNLKSVQTVVWLLVFINFLSLILFHSDQGERHFLPSLPIVFIFLGGLFSSFYSQGKISRFLISLSIFLIVLINISSLIHSHASFGLADKQRAVEFVARQTSAGKFYLDSIGDCHKWGYRYLFSYLNHEPAGSYLDNNFTWMYNRPPHPQDSKVRVTFLSPNQYIPEPDWLRAKRYELAKKAFEKEKFGNIEVFLENP